MIGISTVTAANDQAAFIAERLIRKTHARQEQEIRVHKQVAWEPRLCGGFEHYADVLHVGDDGLGGAAPGDEVGDWIAQHDRLILQIRGLNDVIRCLLARMSFIAEADVGSELPVRAPVVLKVASEHLDAVRLPDRLQLHLVRDSTAEK